MMDSLFKKKRNGASLAEMIVALYVLAIVLLGMMAGVLITQGTIYHKERERATEIALHTLESREALSFEELSNDKEFKTEEGKYRIIAESDFNNVPVLSADSANISVTVSWGSALAGEQHVKMTRKVSASAWQSVGEFLDD